MSETLELLRTVIKEIREDGFEPKVAFVGPKFAEKAAKELEALGLNVYVIKELNCDAIIANPRFLGHLRKASRRISLEPLREEREMWEEIRGIGEL
ncbi:family 4B encapsulin nanocompartment shell protein [Thermococcus sp. 2319x1]|uniref:family 4B encapsulin nanocompartment shell protein n=1 Tax=Thermococcus sp. 2319x1 TaxID=1674923 RepID=UPI0015815845|nr:family 4B encapsulin nanocompartment shell protein [Thermococcus sp. 2319x1]